MTNVIYMDMDMDHYKKKEIENNCLEWMYDF